MDREGMRVDRYPSFRGEDHHLEALGDTSRRKGDNEHRGVNVIVIVGEGMGWEGEVILMIYPLDLPGLGKVGSTKAIVLVFLFPYLVRHRVHQQM